MQFLVTLYDGTDAEAPVRRAATRPAHLAGLKGNVADGKLLFGGPLFDDAQKPVGSFLLVECADRAELDAIIANAVPTRRGMSSRGGGEADRDVVMRDRTITLSSQRTPPAGEYQRPSARQSWKRNASHAIAPATTTTGIRISANHSANDAIANAAAKTQMTTAHAKIRVAIGGRRGRKLPSGSSSISGGMAKSWRIRFTGSRWRPTQRRPKRESRPVPEHAVPARPAGRVASAGPDRADAKGGAPGSPGSSRSGSRIIF